MRKTKWVRVEASVLLQYEEEIDSLPASLPTPSEVEGAMAKAVLAAWRKAKKTPALYAIGAGRFKFTLLDKGPARRRTDEAKARPGREGKP